MGKPQEFVVTFRFTTEPDENGDYVKRSEAGVKRLVEYTLKKERGISRSIDRAGSCRVTDVIEVDAK